MFTVIKWGRVEEIICPYVVVLCQLIHLRHETIQYTLYFKSLTYSSLNNTFIKIFIIINWLV